MCVSIVVRPDVSTVGRTPMLVTDGVHDAADRRRRRIDAVRRQQLVLGAEVRGRKADRPAALVAAHDRAVDAVLMAEQRAGLVDAPLADQPADPRAADDEVLVADRIDLLGLEAVAAAERRAAARSCRRDRGRTESSRRPRPPATRSQSTSTVRTNVSGSHRDSSGVKRTMAAPCTPARCDRLELLRRGHQQRRRLVGPDDARRMRIEGHHDGRGAALAGDAAHAIEDLAVAAVHAVEVAEREHRLHPARRPRVVGKVDDVHQTTRSDRIVRSAIVQHQPIIGQLHAGGQARAGRGVRQVVADVREVRALGAEPRDDVERFARR